MCSIKPQKLTRHRPQITFLHCNNERAPTRFGRHGALFPFAPNRLPIASSDGRQRLQFHPRPRKTSLYAWKRKSRTRSSRSSRPWPSRPRRTQYKKPRRISSNRSTRRTWYSIPETDPETIHRQRKRNGRMEHRT